MTPDRPDATLEVSTDELERSLRTWLPAQRWYAGKGHAITSLTVSSRTTLDAGSAERPRVDHLLVDVTADGLPDATYQVPLGFRAEVHGDLARWSLPAAPDADAGPAVYDGLRDPAVITLLAAALADRRDAGPLRFRAVDGSGPLEVGTTGRVLGAEQSNRSEERRVGKECLL